MGVDLSPNVNGMVGRSGDDRVVEEFGGEDGGIGSS
jgi:hypothetical protein